MDEVDAAALLSRFQDDPQSFGRFVEECRDRLRRVVDLRMHPDLRARVDASDVVQDACTEALERLPKYLGAPDLPPFLWLRFLAGQRLLQLQRHHLGAQMRDARLETPIEFGGAPEASSVVLASAFVDSGVLSPSRAAEREEVLAGVRAAIEAMKPEDREILVLRHFEQLSSADAARVLGLSESGASSRHLRALARLREALGSLE